MKALDQKLNQYFGGKVVRKDLTKLVKGNAVVPTYVLEYLLGQYCATDDEVTIQAGVETVKDIIAKHFVHRDEAQIIKSTIREKGSHRIIDKVSVKLNENRDRYEASFANLGLKRVVIEDGFIRQHRKLLSEGVWCIIVMGYLSSEERDTSPWLIESLKPIQISDVDLEEYKSIRELFSKEEWIDTLMQTIGLNPDEFTFRSKLIQLARLIPFAEHNYNLIELGPKGTGKSHVFTELSPHSILISGGEVTKAKLFINMSTGEIGLVGYWDVVAYDEFAGKNKRVDKALVDSMKLYMANKTFSRGTQVHGATASMVFVGNTNHTVAYMLKHSDLFEALPKEYYDTAFLDRIHAYLPGWEVQKLRNEMFTDGYGFIVDYLAEVLKELRKEDHMHDYKDFFELSNSITTRDKDGIAKTYSGMIKVIYPHGKITELEAKEIMDFAIESRKRVKQQLVIMDETYEHVDFSYQVIRSGVRISVETLESSEYPSHGKNEEIESQTESISEKPIAIKKQPVEGHRMIRDNATGYSYDSLFGDYLEGAQKVVIIDPYIRYPYQLRNLMEFAKLIIERKQADEEVSLHLITNNDDTYLDNAREYLNQIKDSLEPSGLYFTYEFDDSIHDRSITLSNGWKIVLGRGLDIFQKTGGWYDIAEYDQTKRQCKATEINYVRDLKAWYDHSD